VFKNIVFEAKLQQSYKEIQRCQYLNTSVLNVGTKRNFWKKAAAKASTFAKNVEVQICRDYFQVFPSGKAVREAIPAQPERVPLERAAFNRKDCL